MHKIVFWNGSTELAKQSWSLGLETAKTHACGRLAVYDATHVQVIDMDKQAVVFSYAVVTVSDEHAIG